MTQKLAEQLRPGDRIVNGGTVIGPALSRRVPLNADAIAAHEVGFPIRYSNGMEAVRIFPKGQQVELEVPADE